MKTFCVNGKTYRQVNITKAKKLHGEGTEIFMLQSNANPNSFMTQFSEIRDTNFDHEVNAFAYYNCNNMLGKRVNFYNKVS